MNALFLLHSSEQEEIKNAMLITTTIIHNKKKTHTNTSHISAIIRLREWREREREREGEREGEREREREHKRSEQWEEETEIDDNGIIFLLHTTKKFFHFCAFFHPPETTKHPSITIHPSIVPPSRERKFSVWVDIVFSRLILFCLQHFVFFSPLLRKKSPACHYCDCCCLYCCLWCCCCCCRCCVAKWTVQFFSLSTCPSIAL